MSAETKKNAQVLKRISELEQELQILKTSLKKENTVNAPADYSPIFEKAQKTVNDYFSNLKLQPSKGTIEINDERYILVRASSLSNEFFKNIENLYKDKPSNEAFGIASSFLFDIGHLIGKQDAKRFHEKMNLQNPLEKMSAGPVHFAHAGWAFVEILPESNPVPNENFFIKYNHPYSFEADSWLQANEKTDQSVCVMNAAYSSGWCEESYGIPLTAVEISCRAKGDSHCTFIMAHPEKIESIINKESIIKKSKYKPQIPFFFERKKNEEAIIQNESFLKAAQKISKLGSWEFNIETNELIWSEELFNIYSIDPKTDKSELYEIYLSRFDTNDLQELFRCIEKAKCGEKYTFQHGIELSEGTKKWILCSGIPIKDANEKVIKLMGYAQDITRRISTEIQLNKYFTLSSDMLSLIDFEGKFVKVSQGWTKSLGYSEEELVGQKFIQFVHIDDVEKTIAENNNLKNGAFTMNFENRYRAKNGDYKLINWNASPDYATQLLYSVARDVTEERIAEQKLKQTLHEKEILLKEVHHRVKNNMQIISSLLNLQSTVLDDKAAINLLKESKNRVHTIASIHEIIYQSKNFEGVNFKDYLQNLLPYLIYSYHGSSSEIKFTIDANVTFTLNTSIPLGLLINEIVSNALKHGLKNKKGDLILVSIKTKDKKNYELVISDNGKGFKNSTTNEKIETLGLMLINELTKQLNGTIVKQDVSVGTSYCIAFEEI